MTNKQYQARTAIKPLNTQFDDDLKRFYADRQKYKYIHPRPENNSFAVIIKTKQRGSRKLLDDAWALKEECLNETVK